jgi:hypothetical protein
LALKQADSKALVEKKVEILERALEHQPGSDALLLPKNKKTDEPND